MDEETPKSPVLPKTVEIPNVLYAIEQGLYDGQFQQIINAMNERRKARQDAVMAQVREVFGEDATIHWDAPTESDSKQAEKPNPFMKKAAEKQPIRATNLSQEEIDRIDEILPGPYKTNPDDNNSYRVSTDHGNGMLEITDIFGGHSYAVPKLEWDEWQDTQLETSEPDSHTTNGLGSASTDQVTAPGNETSSPIEAQMVSQGGVENVPPELRGPIIGGLSAGDMGI